MKKCKKCIIIEGYPGVTFNEEGICNLCTNYEPQELLGENKFIELFNSLKQEGKYDCVVPLSGGKDSCFILYYLKKKCNLNPVAINYDSGMQAEIAIRNQKNVCKALNIPLIIKRADYRIQAERIKAMIRYGERLGRFEVGCGGCVPILQTVAIGYAQEHNIPIVVDGASLKEYYPLKQYDTIERAIRFFFRCKFYNLDIIKYISFFKYLYYDRKLNKQMKLYSVKIPPPDYPYSFKSGNVTMIRFSSFIEWPENKIVEVLKTEVNWEHPSVQDKRFDCLLHCMGEHACIQKDGISSNAVIYSQMIREGLLTRDDAEKKELGPYYFLYPFFPGSLFECGEISHRCTVFGFPGDQSVKS
ncbi:MAG: hypothetical protein ACFFAO_11185 [Candidatus Hermodarchaeota archaeon]